MKHRRKSASPFSLFAFQDIITSVCGIIVLVTLLLTLELSMRVVSEEVKSSPEAEEYERLQTELEELKSQLQEVTVALNDEQRKLRDIPRELRETTVGELEDKSQRVQNEIDEIQKVNEENERKIKEAKEKLAEKQKADEEKAHENDDLHEQIAHLKEELSRYRRDAEKNRNEHTVIYTNNDKNRKPYLVDIRESSIQVALISDSDRDKVSFQGEEYLSDFFKWAGSKDEHKYYFVLVIRPSGILAGGLIEYILNKADRHKYGIDMISEDQKIDVE